MEKKSCPGCGGVFTPLTDGGLRAHGPVGARCDQTAKPVDPNAAIDAACGRGTCEECGEWVRVRKDGQLSKHESRGFPCEGRTAMSADSEQQQCSEPTCTCEGNGGPGHELAIIGAFDEPGPALGPREQLGEKGPWFGAEHVSRCSSCEDPITEGDRIRADGESGYECGACGDSQATAVTYQEQASAAAKRHLATLPSGRVAQVVGAELPAEPVFVPDDAQAFMDFEDPTKPEDKPRKLNVSGQPEAERDWLGRYIVKDPELGDFRRTQKGKPFGITRVTTFNKAAQDSKAINDWGKRNVVIGASLRPDILRRAHGLVHDTGRDELNRIVADLDTAAGGKVSADEGTYLHEETELIDAGLKTWRDSPPAYQQDLKRYVEALEGAGLEPVPGLIERTTMISEFGGVCGTFDRVCYHRPSDSYVVVDLKTGKTMKYAMDETETQVWCYAHGVNQNGIYDWNTKTWVPLAFDPARGSPVRVREDVGVIIHMPVQGPEAGTVNVLMADLEAGRAHAELCHAVRSKPKRKPAPWASWASWAAPEPPRPGTWEELFAAVRDKEHATELWRSAKAEGIEGVRLNELIRIAREALAGKG